MEDLFGSKLSGGPLSDILGDYSSNKLLSKSRITNAEREEYENEQLQKKEREMEERKKRKRQLLSEKESDEYIIPQQLKKKMRHSSHGLSDGTHHNHSNNHDGSESGQAGGDADNDDKKVNYNILKTYTEQQIMTRLRSLQQPIKYFGETHEQRLLRLRSLLVIEYEREQGASKGLTNAAQSIANEVERELEQAMAQTMGGEMKTGDGNKESGVDHKKDGLKKNKYDLPRTRASFEFTEDFVLFFFKRLLREWEQHLLQRSEDEKMSANGKRATMLQKQARRDIRAFIKQLKTRQIPRDVLAKSEKIVFAAEKRNYVEAKRIFFEMAIGNAPWPMGVTMVGIHERSGRSKIFSSQIAHVLNDEVQRKYIHAMARLISFAQSKYPSEDLTKNMG